MQIPIAPSTFQSVCKENNIAGIGTRLARPDNSPVCKKLCCAQTKKLSRNAVKPEETLVARFQDGVIYYWLIKAMTPDTELAPGQVCERNLCKALRCFNGRL